MFNDYSHENVCNISRKGTMSMVDENLNDFHEESARSHFTIIPNIISHMGLDVWEFRAYHAFKETAGDRGACSKSNSTLCLEIGCSLPTLIKIKESLMIKGLIIIRKQFNPNGGSMPDLITIVDMWQKNYEGAGT
jgi:hypothetical protein